MSSAQEWAEALGSSGGERFTLQFSGSGLTAECRALPASEVEECRSMGGTRGLRYALYLSCDALRQAGEALRRKGELGSAFEITERLGYGDAALAGLTVLRRSGLVPKGVTVESGGVRESAAFSGEYRPEEGFLPPDLPEGRVAFADGGMEEQNRFSAGALVREFSDRLTLAAVNR